MLKDLRDLYCTQTRGREYQKGANRNRFNSIQKHLFYIDNQSLARFLLFRTIQSYLKIIGRYGANMEQMNYLCIRELEMGSTRS